MRLIVLFLLVALASSKHHHGGHHFRGHKLLRQLSHPAKGEVEVLDKEVATAPAVVKDGKAKMHPKKPVAHAADQGLRTKVKQMSSKIQQLQQQLRMARAHPPPPPFARFFRKFGPHHKFDPHHPPPPFFLKFGPHHKFDPHHPPPPPHREFRFERWRHHGGRRRHHFWHGVLCVGILSLLMYGTVRLCRRCCCNSNSAANTYPAYVVSGSPARGGVVHNPYVGVSSAAVVPTAEGHAVPTGSAVPMAFASASAPEQLQHGVVIGTPVNF